MIIHVRQRLHRGRKIIIPAIILIAIKLLNNFLKKKSEEGKDFFKKEPVYQEYPLDAQTIKFRLEGFVAEIGKNELQTSV